MSNLKRLLCCSGGDGIQKAKYKVGIETGDKKSAGTDADVDIILHGEEGSSEKSRLDKFFRNDFEKGKKDVFDIHVMKLSKIESIELFSDSATDDKWYVNVVDIKNEDTGQSFVFPIYRWIKAKSSIKIAHLDTFLPQVDRFQDERQQELDEKKEHYQLEVKIPGLPPQIKDVPGDEEFSINYMFDLGSKATAIMLKAEITKKYIPGDRWKSLDHIKESYISDILPVPESFDGWKEDVNFGRKRIACFNSSLIKLCKEIPKKFAVTEEVVKPFLDGLTLQQALEQNRIFIVDLELLKGIPRKDGFEVCDPMALLFVNESKVLLPIAIQLYQDPSEDNPVFVPSDPEYTWMVAKMWFNNADSAYHQSVTHLGFTHLLMEGFSVITHRELSPSHPLFKLLAPHFLYMIAINRTALSSLVGEGKWVDRVMNIGRLGMFELIRRRIKTWRLDLDGTLPKDFSNRGVLSEEVLPGYYFRDDALKLYNIIRKYVSDYVDIYYDTDSKLSSDWELERWSKHIVKPIEDGGLGIMGVPVGEDGKIRTKEDLNCIITSIIYTCSGGHAAANFQQYDEYGFPPNYPVYMRGKPPKDKSPLTEQDILDSLPDQEVTLSIMTISKLLSEKATYSLGQFEVMYIHDPKALAALNDFQNELQKLSKTIKDESSKRLFPYEWLDPSIIPNAISI